MRDLLWGVAGILFVVWLIAFYAFDLTGDLVHLIFVLAVVAALVRMLTGRRALA